MDDELGFFYEDDMTAANTETRATTNNDDKQYDDHIFKHWFKTSSKGGFLTIHPWLEAGKLSVDVGETGDGGLKGNTKVWVNAIDLAVYLRTVAAGSAEKLYRAYPKGGIATNEGFAYFGGGTMEGKPVSRVLKVHYWTTGKDAEGNATYDNNAFVWKCGHFAARKSQSGAFIPDMSSPLSINSIKIPRIKMAEMSYRLDLALHSFAARNEDPMRSLNGNNR